MIRSVLSHSDNKPSASRYLLVRVLVNSEISHSAALISSWLALSGVRLELVVVPAEQLHQLGVNEELLFAKRHFAQHAQGRKVVQVA